MKIDRKIPYDFVLEALGDCLPIIRPMFGCTAIYIGPKIVLILRKKDNEVQDNGVWLATRQEHHDSLKREFPRMRSITLFGPGVSGWQILPEDAPSFEEDVFRVCQLVVKNDSRIGKLPKTKSLEPKEKKPHKKITKTKKSAKKTKRKPVKKRKK